MSTVSVTKLKAKLSEYLREIKRGGEVQVLERGVPIARLTRIEANDNKSQHKAPQRRQRLIANGILRAGTGALEPLPPIECDADLRSAVAQDREDRI